MGIDVHIFLECDFQDSDPPFTSPSSVRSLNQGEFFVWRDLDLFHTLGLDYYENDLPTSPIVLTGIPTNLSWNLIEKNGIIIDDRIQTIDRDRERIPRFPVHYIDQWRNEELQIFEISNPADYNIELTPDEKLVFDPGCQLPNCVMLEEIQVAFKTCNPKGSKIDYFMAIVAMMERMASCLSPRHVRMIYWFDCLSPEYMRRYQKKHNL